MTFRLRSFAALCAALVAFTGPASSAFAEGDGGMVQAAPSEAGTVMHAEITVERKAIQVRKTLTETGEALYDARPIIEALKGKITLDGTIFSVVRFQDRAELSIDMADGKVRAGDSVLGKLPDWTARETADTWLSVNAITILTGTHAKDAGDGQIELTLDDRLRPQFDLDLFVDGERLAFLEEEPRTIGPILLIPLRDVAEALGHEVTEDPVEGTVTVIRVQDSARFTLDLSTGLVLLNDEPQGLTSYISYADPDTLLLPFSAVETLTGTHIKLLPGTDRIDVRLDDRLAGAAMPGALVDEDAAAAGFVPESLSYTLSDQGDVSLTLDAHVRQFNTRTLIDARNPVENPVPTWMSTEIQSLAGWRATVGDATTRYRELSGVDTSRIRGGTFQKIRENGNLLSVAAGLPVTGSENNGDSGNRPTFGGFAAGATLIQPEKNREIGVSALNDEDTGATSVVARVQQEFLTQAGADDRPGLQTIYATADVGGFSGGDKSFGVRGQVDAVYQLSSVSSLRAALSHDSEAFRASPPTAQTDDATLEGVFDTRVGARTTGHLSVDWRATDNFDLIHNVGAGGRVAISKIGDTTTQSASASISGRIGERGVDVSASVGVSNTQSSNGDSDGVSASVNVRALKRFDWGMAQVNVTSASDTEGETNTRVVANVSADPFRKSWPNGVTLTASPSFTAVASEDTQFTSLGGSALVDSGPALGERTRIRAQVSALQSINPEDTKTRLFARISGHYDVNRALRIEGSFSDDFEGAQRFTLELRGSVNFNPPRKHTSPEKDTGVLTGQVFFDRNRDGIQQDDEPGIPSVRVALRQTRLGLQVDSTGQFTIQNLPTGLYSVSVDRRTLPLGLLVPEETLLRATIGDGRITNVSIPVIASGQVRGTIFEDSNDNDELDQGEARYEGARLALEQTDGEAGENSVLKQQYAAGFGQYAFENLPPGTYRLTIEYHGRRVVRDFELIEEDLFHVEDIGFASEAKDSPDTQQDDPFEGVVDFVA
ncbi:MAG: SdrD B-like domain-containing protein [Pseudomonadota bacterium]